VRRIITTSILTLTIVALGACGGSDESTNTDTVVDSPDQAPLDADGLDTSDVGAAPGTDEGVCGLLSQEEVESLAGTPVSPGISMTIGEADGCNWAAMDGRLDLALQVREVPASEFDGMISGEQDFGITVIPVEGIGDAAYSSEPGYTTELVFRTDGVAYGVTAPVDGGSQEQLRAANEAAARKLLENL